MRHRNNCHNNAVAEGFMFYNSKHQYGSSIQMSPTECDNQYYQRLG
ncbi:ISEhe3, transposase orfB [Escherichia coli]|nr:ISEhe3, transposase orfB [Escherichia coli]CAD5794410.1 ISEhe3, transposase orfB [Escherichia coli]